MTSNITSGFNDGMYPYWYGCQAVLLDTTPFEKWFDEAEANTAIIATMSEALPLSVDGLKGFRSVIEASRTTDAALERKNSLAKAKEEFDEFLALRKRVTRSVFSNRNLWYYYADNSKEVDELRLIATQSEQELIFPDKTKASSKGPVCDETGWTDAAERAARITTNLVQTHYEIWNHDGAGAAMVKHLDAAAKHVKHASSSEFLVTATLARVSAKPDLWDARSEQHSLGSLERKLVWAQRSTQELLNGLRWAQDHVTEIPDDIRSPKHRAREWTVRMQRLIRNWEILIQNSHQGMLFFLRRNELKVAGKDGLATVDFNQSWADWKARNCGGTSCYDEDGIVHRTLKRAGVSYLPLARRAGDENKWCNHQRPKEKPFVWQGVYEDACCRETDLIDFLKYGPISAIYKPRLIDEL
ncbi:hypothetical protein F4821DRAFT_225470 [Hypoxylon rubiginosum]|uniref:Uncharacterized protein n=1 Tax=Hypoxylon rubiginosum TaxID=110542 RepID=A0ACC0DGE7_9PEZI|nr:hypothetical protein F4821DRAFT_225470 [Hypoxylon rubiginosum]